MSADLVKRLRRMYGDPLVREAAAEIERLRALVLMLSEANRRYSKAVSRETAEMIKMEDEEKP